MKEIEIKTEYIKLDQFLKFAGIIVTGGMAKEMIAGEKVIVNDEICIMRGKKLHNGDRVKVGLEEFIVKQNG